MAHETSCVCHLGGIETLWTALRQTRSDSDVRLDESQIQRLWGPFSKMLCYNLCVGGQQRDLCSYRAGEER